MVTHKIEIFSSQCHLCDRAYEHISAMACPSCDVSVLFIHDPDVSARAAQLGIEKLPAVAVNGQLLSCCTGCGIDEEALKAAGVGNASE